MTAIATTAARPSDFADLVNLLQQLTETTAALRKLEGKVTARYIDTVTDSVEEYKALQTKLSETEAALAVIAERNPQWYSEKKTVETPFGEVKRTSSTELVIADEAATIALIRAANRSEDFLRITTTVNREALESLEDDALAKLGVSRKTTHNFKPAAAKVDLGKAVKAAEKSAGAAAKTARAARS